MARIACIPFVLYFIDNYSPVRSFIAMLIYVGAALTDFARRLRWRASASRCSVLGKFLDPLADKLIVTSVLVYLTAMDRCPAWLVVALLAREFAVTGLRSIATTEGLVISASDSGKQKTALQLIGTIFLLIHFKYPVWGLEERALPRGAADDRLSRGRDHHALPGAGDVVDLGARLLLEVRARGAGARRRTPPKPEGHQSMKMIRVPAPALEAGEALRRLTRGERPFLLDGACDADGLGRWSWAGCDPDDGAGLVARRRRRSAGARRRGGSDAGTPGPSTTSGRSPSAI